jgi:hypothetical protein
MRFNVACTPGKDAAVAFLWVTKHVPTLVIYLDPVNVAIQLPPGPDGEQRLAEFCRELAREAAKLAVEVDPDGEPAPPEAHTPRHALVSNEFGDSGAGH